MADSKEVRIPIKEATAKNLMALNQQVEVAKANLVLAEQRVQDSLRPFFTEHDIPQGSRAIKVTEQPPYELVVVLQVVA